MRSIELFTGAGGLALGIHQAGFEHAAIAEWDKHSVKTLERNRHLLGLDNVEIARTDVTTVHWKRHASTIDLLAGGVPCQPFSLGGQHRGHEDHRNLFPEMVRAVREIGPAAVLVENVKGLLRPSFQPFFDYVVRQLEMPELTAREGEDWVSHDRRLQREKLEYKRGGYLRYRAKPRLIQCADYGVPQTRERVLIVAYRSDLDLVWEPPPASHTYLRLIYEQFTTGDYWKEYPDAPRRRPTPEQKAEADAMRDVLLGPGGQRWQTVRDALKGLPSPAKVQLKEHVDDEFCWACHWGNPGARKYPGHDGSHRDWPSKTLKAGVHGVPGGENMLRNSNGTVRYFTAREAARIQTFPDDYHFEGIWGEVFRQLGNAVPVSVGKLVAQQIAAAILSSKLQQPTEQPTLVASG